MELLLAIFTGLLAVSLVILWVILPVAVFRINQKKMDIIVRLLKGINRG